MNGTLAHSLDYDDTHLPSVLHPSATVVPAALAAAESSGAKGRDLLAAIAAGNELVVRVGMAGYDPALGNSIFFERRFARHLHRRDTRCCTRCGAGLRARGRGARSRHGDLGEHGRGDHRGEPYRGTVKRIHCGWAAHAGVTAAELAARGLTGPPTALEGRFGFAGISRR